VEGERNDGFSLRLCVLPLALTEEVCVWLSRVWPWGWSPLHHHGWWWEAGLAAGLVWDEDLGGSCVSLRNGVRVVASIVRCCPAISKARLGRGEPAVVGWPVALRRWAGRPCRGGAGRKLLSSASLSTLLWLEDLGR